MRKEKRPINTRRCSSGWFLGGRIRWIEGVQQGFFIFPLFLRIFRFFLRPKISDQMNGWAKAAVQKRVEIGWKL